MSQYDNTNRGSIWKNDRKEKDTHPDFKGSLNVEGKEYWVSAWKRKEGANPKAPALSFSIQAKENAQAGGASYPSPSQPGGTEPAQAPESFVDDDLPF